MMDRIEQLRRFMDAASGEDAEALETMLESMNEVDKAYFSGYIEGYADAVGALNRAMLDEHQPAGVESA